MQLTEIFDSGYEWKYDRDGSSPTHTIAAFRTDDGSRVRVYMMSSSLGRTDLEISTITFTRDLSQGTTGQGDEFKIFATVTDIVKKTTALKHWEIIQFAADKSEPSRVSLYRKLSQKFVPHNYVKLDSVEDLKKLSDAAYDGYIEEFKDDLDGMTVFIFVKKDLLRG